MNAAATGGALLCPLGGYSWNAWGTTQALIAHLHPHTHTHIRIHGLSLRCYALAGYFREGCVGEVLRTSCYAQYPYMDVHTRPQAIHTRIPTTLTFS